MASAAHTYAGDAVHTRGGATDINDRPPAFRAVLTGLALRKAILETLRARKGDNPETSLILEGDLTKELKVDHDRLDAHFTFLERGGYVTSLRMPGPDGTRLRYLTITETGEKYLKNARNFETPKGTESPFKVIEKGQEKVLDDPIAIRIMVAKSDWVLDEERDEIVAKLDELAKALESDRFDPAEVSRLKLYFERYKWLSPHVAAAIKKQYGF